LSLVVGGQIDLLIEGVRTKCLAGDVFHLARNQVHAEWYGNQGVQYLASRKYLP
jgi:quercetin dioxygenase-like cupin family protein